MRQKQFYSKVAGVTRENQDQSNRQKILADYRKLNLVREHDNPYDANAIKVLISNGKQIGYINSDLARELAPIIDKGKKTVEAHISEITGGTENKQSIGCNIFITIK
jgi:hypothetical protein